MKLIYLFLILALSACGTSKAVKELNIIDKKVEVSSEPSFVYNTKIVITRFSPYCGGAAPDQYTLDNQTALQVKTKFILLNLDSGAKSTVQTDSTGTLYLNLSKGDYAIRELYKDCSYEEFEAEYRSPDVQYYQPSSDIDCYRNWWASNLGEMTITNTDSLYQFNWQISAHCFTGINPCISYDGPWPP